MEKWWPRTLLVLLEPVIASTCVAGAMAPQSFPNLDLMTDGGVVHVIVRQPDGGVVFGGRFSRVDGVPRGNVARLLPDGRLDMQWAPMANSEVLAAAVNAHGDVFIAGWFNSVSGVMRNGIARIAGQGSGEVNAVWDPSPSGRVHALAVNEDGDVFAGGSFWRIGGVYRANFAKLSGGGKGLADVAWNPGASHEVSAIALDADGWVYVDGAPPCVEGSGDIQLRRFQSDGVGLADPDWAPCIAGGKVNALVVDDVGHLVIGGSFTSVDGLRRNRIARLSRAGTGAVDALWDPSANGNVLAIAVDSDGAIYAAGNFSEIGGAARLHIAKLERDGVGQVSPEWNLPSNNMIYTLAAAGDGRIFAGGWFTRIGDAPRFGFATLEREGSVSPRSNNAGHAGWVNSMAVHPDGGVIVGGTFRLANGIRRNNLLKLQHNGAMDPDWDPSADYRVHAVAVDASGEVYVGGEFSRIGGEYRRCIARVSGSGVGEVDPLWRPEADHNVQALAIDSNGYVYVGGSFSEIGGSHVGSLAKLSVTGAGSSITDWQPRPSGLVTALILAGDDTLFVGGDFHSIGGKPQYRLAKLAAHDGLADKTWSPYLDDKVHALAIGHDGNLFVGGEFVVIDHTFTGGFAKLSSTGTGAVDDKWLVRTDGPVYALATSASNTLFVGGSFSAIGPELRSGLAKLSTVGQGEVDPDWAPRLDGPTYASATAASGDSVYVGGRFSVVGDQRRIGLVRLLDDPDVVFADGLDGLFRGDGQPLR